MGPYRLESKCAQEPTYGPQFTAVPTPTQIAFEKSLGDQPALGFARRGTPVW